MFQLTSIPTMLPVDWVAASSLQLAKPDDAPYTVYWHAIAPSRSYSIYVLSTDDGTAMYHCTAYERAHPKIYDTICPNTGALLTCIEHLVKSIEQKELANRKNELQFVDSAVHSS